MINKEEVCSWIEKKNDITLYPTQKRFIDGLISGCDISCPRGLGRTSLTKWYTEYLNEVYSKKRFSFEAEVFITGKELADERPGYQEHMEKNRNMIPKHEFEREFVCDWHYDKQI